MMTLIATSTVGAGGAASIDFTSIPGTPYTDLMLVLSIRESRTDLGSKDGVSFTMKFNNVTTNQSQRSLYYNANGASQSAYSGSDTQFYLWSDTGADTANTFNNGQVYIPNYAGSTNKSVSYEVVGENNALSGGRMGAALWSSTAAINQITLTASTGTFVQYSTASLYGITKGSGGATVSP